MKKILAQSFGSDDDDPEAISALRAAATALIPTVLAERDDKLAQFRELHEADKAAFSFECRRHGDFLAVFITRRDANGQKDKISTAINLAMSRTVMFSPGHEPDLEGSVSFEKIGGLSQVVALYQRQYQHGRMIRLKEDSDSHTGMVTHLGHYDDPLSGMHLRDCPRGAADDTIYFVGPGVTLFAPAGLGQGVYDAILRAKEGG